MSEVQRCVHCDDPTGRCAEDSLFDGDHGPLCESCHDSALNQELARLRSENVKLQDQLTRIRQTFAESSTEEERRLHTENATLRELVREALHPVSHDWRKYWNERAEKALTPPT